jgi:hypothetical protein
MCSRKHSVVFTSTIQYHPNTRDALGEFFTNMAVDFYRADDFTLRVPMHPRVHLRLGGTYECDNCECGIGSTITLLKMVMAGAQSLYCLCLIPILSRVRCVHTYTRSMDVRIEWHVVSSAPDDTTRPN